MNLKDKIESGYEGHTKEKLYWEKDVKEAIIGFKKEYDKDLNLGGDLTSLNFDELYLKWFGDFEK